MEETTVVPAPEAGYGDMHMGPSRGVQRAPYRQVAEWRRKIQDPSPSGVSGVKPKTPARSPREPPREPHPEPPPPEQEEDGESDYGAENEDAEGTDGEQSLTSVDYKEPDKVKYLTVGSQKGNKKPVPLHSVCSTSQKIARDARYGPMVTNDGRKAYAPEVGQTGYDLPEIWLDRIGEMQGLKVNATLGEWANFLMTPTYASLAAHTEQNFRTAFLAITHDVMLRRLKKAAYTFAKETEEAEQEEPPAKGWYKAVDIPGVTRQKVQESDLSPEGKEELKDILSKASVARFKNDCGDLGVKYTHTIQGGVHPPVRQYPLNPGAIEEMGLIIKELSILGVIREEPNPITNSPIQAVKEPESSGGGWMPVINFKALNRRTLANQASLINPQRTLKTLRLKKYKSCINLANAFFSLRLAKASQGKTAFTHKGKAYVWERLPIGYKNSPKCFQSAVMDILDGLEATIYIANVFIADDMEKQHLERLKRVIERLTAAGLKLNLMKCQFGQHQVNYLGFQVSTGLELSDEYREKVERIKPPASLYELQKVLGLCNYVRDHVPSYQRYARPLCARLKKKEPEEARQLWEWTATDQSNLETLKTAIKEALRLEPRSLTAKLVAEVSCNKDDAVVRVSNEDGGIVTLWSYTLSSVEKKYPAEEKELAILARYWSALKNLARGQGIKVLTQSQVHWFLKKATVKSSKATKARWRQWEDILLDPDINIGPAQPVSNKLTMEKWDETPKGRIVPEESVMEVVQAVHEALGHAGTGPTSKELQKQRLWIPELEIRRILKDCELCGQYNTGPRGQRVDGLAIKGTVPWRSVCMDVSGPMGVIGEKGEKYLLVLVDSMSGYVTTRAVRKANGKSVVSMLDQVCSNLGVPRELRTNNSTHFCNAKVDQWCQQYGVMRIYSLPYTPQANEVVKCTIGLVNNWIGKNGNSREWSTKTLDIGVALNDRCRSDRPSPSEELNHRPFKLQ
ncbi:uncharacterized protein LOC116396347 [Anarrhichthys ocellatus]|uniref:uncharacterized protein LOC116396347 n=1 Tax=Anarrhichthys ocellatus TaxID=433405 RepID=UPI0012EE42F1|nr:uncharacterized protein LOC116396347 [Anarrhichthys ocellatus]